MVGLAMTCARASSIDEFAGRESAIRGPAVKLARRAVETYLKTGKTIPTPRDLPRIFSRPAGVFVTMSKDGKRRGCKGTFEPVTSSLAEEIIQSAIGAATTDIRYRPIRTNELAELTFTVSIVGPPRRVQDSDGYSARTHGLLLRCSSGSGVILPGEAKTSTWRLAEARRQASAKRGESCELFVFQTVALHEDVKAPQKRRR